MALTHLSLFSGIGGLDLAAEMAGFTTVGQCEFADYPTKVLEKHWPDVPRWRDIHDLSADDFFRRIGRKEITVISGGGFPCQPHSLAGKRKASCDERDLWPEYRRVVGEIRPKWVVAENVRGLLTSEDGRFFRGILRDFADLGYDAGWCAYPASWVGAVHRRERVFVIAYSDGKPRTLSVLNRNGAEVKRRDKGTEVWSEDRFVVELGCESYEYLRTAWRQLAESGLVRTGTRSTTEVDEIRERLTALGNTVVPQQAYPIFKAIAEIETGSGGK